MCLFQNPRNLIYKVLPLLLGLLLVISCDDVKLKWPDNITSSMFIPKGANLKSAYDLEGSHQVIYRIKECFPAEAFINDLVQHMSNRGWIRRDYDFLNPQLKLHHAREGGLETKWGRLVDPRKGIDVYQWFEDWEDGDKNIVRYVMKYKAKRGHKVTIGNNCELQVNIIYIPKTIRPDSNELEKKVDEINRTLRDESGENR